LKIKKVYAIIYMLKELKFERRWFKCLYV